VIALVATVVVVAIQVFAAGWADDKARTGDTGRVRVTMGR
jgi:hypothetical protein